MNIKTTLKSSVAAAALFAIALPVAAVPNSAEAADDTLKSGNKNSLTISGQVNRAIWHADDGHSDATFVTSGDANSNSRTRWIATGAINETVSVGATIEMDIPLSNPQASMTLSDASGAAGIGGLGNSGTETANATNWGISHEYVWVDHKKLGTLRLGQTDPISNGKNEADFSNTGAFMTNTAAKTFGTGIFFINTTGGTKSISTSTAGNTITQHDGRSRTDVIRYDTPRFFGLQLGVDYVAGGDWDVGGDYGAKFGPVQVNLRAFYENRSATAALNAQDESGVSAAAIHDSGINAAIAYGHRTNRTAPTGAAAGRNDSNNLSWAVGYRAKIFALGTTDFNFAWNSSEDVNANSQDGDAITFIVNQNLDDTGIDIGLMYSNYSLDQPGQTFDDIDVVAFAMRVAF